MKQTRPPEIKVRRARPVGRPSHRRNLIEQRIRPNMRIVNTPEGPPKRGSTANYPTDIEGIRARIEHVLYLYPQLNFTMLQVGLGTGFRPYYWRPVLAQMIEDGTLHHWEEMRAGPTGRYNMYSFITLSQKRKEKLDAERQDAIDGKETEI